MSGKCHFNTKWQMASLGRPRHIKSSLANVILYGTGLLITVHVHCEILDPLRPKNKHLMWGKVVGRSKKKAMETRITFNSSHPRFFLWAHRGRGPLLIFKQPFRKQKRPLQVHPGRSFGLSEPKTFMEVSFSLVFDVFFGGGFGIFLANFKGWIELQTNKPIEIHHEIIASILRWAAPQLSSSSLTSR